VTLFLIAVFTCVAHAARVEQGQPLIKARQAVTFYRSATWRWQDKRLARHTQSKFNERRTRSLPYIRSLAKLWQRRDKAARVQYQRWFSALYSKWACIHRGEAAWNANTGNGYYGGLQMDLTFQRSYNGRAVRRYGTADKWPIREQLIAAERAYRSGRGYSPWPNTARACGLL
jgi:hypothetical protein